MSSVRSLASFYKAGLILSLPIFVLSGLSVLGLHDNLLAASFGGVAAYYILFALFEKPRLFFVPKDLTTGVMRLMTAGIGLACAIVPVDLLIEISPNIVFLLFVIAVFFLGLAFLGVGFEPDSGDR